MVFENLGCIIYKKLKGVGGGVYPLLSSKKIFLFRFERGVNYMGRRIVIIYHKFFKKIFLCGNRLLLTDRQFHL
jgi:hypothetical protein